MRIETTLSTLTKAVKNLPIDATAPRVIRRYMLVSANAAGVHVEGSDLDLETTVRAPLLATVGEAGAMVVPYKALKNMLRKATPKGRKAPDPVVILSSTGLNKVTVQIDNLSIALDSMDAENFPQCPVSMEFPEFPMEASYLSDKLRTAIQRTIFATSLDHYPLSISGLYFEASSVTATDGHRLAQATLPPLGSTPNNAILPASGMRVLLSYLDHDESVSVADCRQYRVFYCRDGTTIAVKRIDCTFPNYHSVLDPTLATKPITTVRLDSNSLLLAIDKLSIATNDKDQCAMGLTANGTVNLTFKGNTMVVNGHQRGEDITKILYNRYYLRDVAALNFEVLDCAWVAPLEPVLFTALGFRYLLMPMEIGSDKD